MSIYDVDLAGLRGEPLDLHQFQGQAVLIVNVASRCGLTPQYTGLERLQQRFGGDGFTVLGVPCNQFGAQEPGGPEEIATFCSTAYGVSFPLTEKVDVNGDQRHPLYRLLVARPDAAGHAGDIQWNFEKFLVSREARSWAVSGPRPTLRPTRSSEPSRRPCPPDPRP